jgi:hypothetical protein
MDSAQPRAESLRLASTGMFGEPRARDTALPQLDPRGLLVIHDASSHFKLVREAALRLEAEGLISAVLLSTPRGVVVAQRRDVRI